MAYARTIAMSILESAVPSAVQLGSHYDGSSKINYKGKIVFSIHVAHFYILFAVQAVPDILL